MPKQKTKVPKRRAVFAVVARGKSGAGHHSKRGYQRHPKHKGR
jgi:hypothetical protein